MKTITTELEQVKQDVAQVNAELEQMRDILREAASLAVRNTNDIANLTIGLNRVSQQAEQDRTSHDLFVRRAKCDRVLMTQNLQLIAKTLAEIKGSRLKHAHLTQHLY